MFLGDDRTDLMTMYMPDFRVNVGITHEEKRCDPWLEASLAFEARIAADGSIVGVELETPDGAVFFYGAEGDYEEAEIIEGLGGLFDLLLSFVGSSLEFDLAETLGANPLPGLDSNPRITGLFPIPDEQGQPLERTRVISLDIF